MIKLICLFIVILFYPYLCLAVPSIDSVDTQIHGTSFGTKTTAAPVGYDNFEDGIINDVFKADLTNLSLITDVVRTNSSYSVRRNNLNTAGALGFLKPSTTDGYYTSFWAMIPSGITWPYNGQLKMVRIGWVSGTDCSVTFMKHEFTADREHLADVEPDLNYNEYYGEDTLWDDGQWHFFECWFKPSTGIGNTDGQIMWTIDKTVLVNDNSIRTDSAGKNNFDGQWYVIPYFRDGSLPMYYDDVYFDYTQARVMIGNASTFSSCTHREIQIPTSWSDTSITITYNNGSFVPGDRGYLFVIDADGNASAGWDLGTLQADGTWGNLKPVQATNLTMSNVTVGE